jgi:hypothetical protein
MSQLDSQSSRRQAQRAQSKEDISFHLHLIKFFSLCPRWLVLDGDWPIAAVRIFFCALLKKQQS